MLKQFPKNLVHKYTVKYNNKNIPCCLFKAENDCSDFIYINSVGLGGTIAASNLYFNQFFAERNLIAYDKMGSGSNNAKVSKNWKKYVDELKLVVEDTIKKFPNKKIIIIGESWGTSLALLFLKKFPNLIHGIVGWNMPCKIINLEKKTFLEFLFSSFKMLGTIIFNINSYEISKQNKDKLLSSNQVINRMNRISKNNNKCAFAAWVSCRKSWRFILKKKNYKYNYIYIQSKQDVLADWNKWKKFDSISSDRNKYFMKTGYHILAFELKEREELFNIIKKIEITKKIVL